MLSGVLTRSATSTLPPTRFEQEEAAPVKGHPMQHPLTLIVAAATACVIAAMPFGARPPLFFDEPPEVVRPFKEPIPRLSGAEGSKDANRR